MGVKLACLVNFMCIIKSLSEVDFRGGSSCQTKHDSSTVSLVEFNEKKPGFLQRSLNRRDEQTSSLTFALSVIIVMDP